ncbi:uncharacterized protein LOC119554568 [Drosophila subpulchrella]|uniref:uncharacterized protein LOC119554568 n=1 Tax=Drosophila subpulchrella TaxID=1486046 RepID=UPI0018A1AE43|nr:uncharacterized protein LOC119554568 [Drosophila subpulchrella]
MHITVVCLVLTWGLGHSQAATTILHGNGQLASAVSHQSFTRLSSAEPLILQSQKQLVAPSARIVSHHRAAGEQVKRFFPAAEEEKEVQVPIISGQTPAHLTYAAHPVVHQMLPRIKPVRNISFASLVPGPRSLATHSNLSPV